MSPLKVPRRTLSSWAPIDMHLSDENLEKGSKHLSWIVKTINLATSIIDISEALNYTVDTDYTILYDIFELGPKPDQSLGAHFTSVMSTQRSAL